MEEHTGIVVITVSAQASLINGEVDVYGDIPTIIIVQTIKNDSKERDDRIGAIQMRIYFHL